MNAYNKYFKTYSGTELLKKYMLKEYRIWHIKGEDPNCDFGGAHHQPDLGYFTGTLDECVKYAVQLPKFWSWGGGGSITAGKPIMARPDSGAEVVAGFIIEGVREKALAKLTEEEKKVLGLII